MKLQGVCFLLLALLALSGGVWASSPLKGVYTVDSIQTLIKSKTYNCSQLIDYFADKAIRYNTYLRSFITFTVDKAKLLALEQDEYYFKNGKFIGKLHCVPIVVKDNIDVAGVPSSGGIKALRYSIPNEDAAVVAKLRREGAIIIGKANLAELGIGMRYDSEMGGACKNPYDLARSCGASSSGSAAAVAAGLAVFGLGTDTDGSIIGPACFNSLNGLRPARDAMNMSGIIPLFSKQDVVGPLTNYMDDLVLAYSIMTDNSAMFDQYKDLLNRVKSQKETIRIGYITNTFAEFKIYTVLGNYSYYFDQEIAQAFDSFIKKLGTVLPVKAVTQSDNDFNEFVNIIEPITLSRLECQDACYELTLDFYLNNTERFDEDAPYHGFTQLYESKFLSSFWKSFFNESNSADPTLSCQVQCADYERNLTKFTAIIDNWYNVTNADVLFYPSSNQVPEIIGTPNALLSAVFISSYTGYASLNVPSDFTKPGNNSATPLPSGITFLAKQADLVKMFVAAKIYEDSFKDSKPQSALLPSVELGTCSKNHGVSRSYQLGYAILLSTCLLTILGLASF